MVENSSELTLSDLLLVFVDLLHKIIDGVVHFKLIFDRF